jgi:transposase
VYSQGLRARLVQRLVGAGAISATALSRESGVSQQTLSRWLREAPTVASVSDRDSNNDSRRPRRSPEDKLRIVLAASQLSEAELGEFLRREGLHTAQLEEWRKLAMAAAQQALAGGKASTKPTSEAQRIRELERDLDRKNRALAEVTALLALQKKVQALWGDADESTPPKNGT